MLLTICLGHTKVLNRFMILCKINASYHLLKINYVSNALPTLISYYSKKKASCKFSYLGLLNCKDGKKKS